MKTYDQFLAQAKSDFDLTDASDQQSLYQLAENLLTLPEADFAKIKKTALSDKDTPLELRIAIKLTDSRRFIQTLANPIKIGVVFAMWGENNRLLPKSDDNLNGEDSLRTKIAQLSWASQNSPLNWTLYAVDDGCPYGSADIAEKIIASHPLGKQVRILRLAEALPTDSGPLAPLPSADQSRKGGAIILGCHQALTDGADAIIYTDADNSVHLGQIGLLLQPYQKNYRIVLGDRKHPDSVLIKQEGRWGIGIKVLRHMQRMIGEAIYSRDISDTQAAFKLYDRTLLSRIIAKPNVFDFSFDSDWILAAIAADEPFAKVPFAFIDSAAESASITQGPMTTWETLLKGLIKAVRAHKIPHNEEMARVFDEEIKSSADLDLLIDCLPPELEKATDKDLGNPDIMSPAALQTWIQQIKKQHAL